MFIQNFQIFTKCLQKGNKIGWAFLIQSAASKNQINQKQGNIMTTTRPQTYDTVSRALHWLTVLGFIGI
ncbi:MAG: hypothetical protein E6479_03930, partial [Neisseria mucosa]|nr:hypothetical protein [Neisseria mucosa]